MRYATWTLVCLFGLLGSAAADPEGSFDSAEARDRAWAAYRAAERQDATVQPQLEKLLDDENARVRIAALDALIRTKAKVPWKRLEPLFDSNRHEVVILLALHPKAHAKTMLALLGKDLYRDCWLTLCNHLAQQKTPGFVAHLMKDLPLKLEITIQDPDGELIGLGGGCGGAFSCRVGRRNEPEGWPPLMRHFITIGLTKLPLSTGPSPTHYVRARSVRAVTRRPTVLDRFAILEHLTGRPLPVRPSSSILLRADLPPFLVAAAAQAREGVMRSYADTLELLKERKLLTDDEARSLRPQLTVAICDIRTDTTTPLPVLK